MTSNNDKEKKKDDSATQQVDTGSFFPGSITPGEESGTVDESDSKTTVNPAVNPSINPSPDGPPASLTVEFKTEDVTVLNADDRQKTAPPAADKSDVLFGKTEMNRRLQAEMSDIPELGHEEDMETGHMTSLVSKPFINRTSEERLKINRNFLRDAEPMSLEQLKESLTSEPEELLTGFSSLDRHISIPNRKITLVAARPMHGKTVFLLNTFLNMGRAYPDRHFLYYSYGESRHDILLKLINMAGDIPFSAADEGVSTNFKQWKQEFKNRDLEFLQEKAATDPRYKGLGNFLEVCPRLHVMDANYAVSDLVDSIFSFSNTLRIGAVFIDCLQAVRPEKADLKLTRQQQVQAVAGRFAELCGDIKFPLLLGAQMTAPELNTPEYDGLAVDYIKDLKDTEQVANLIIGLQNYSKSMFIGSNINEQFVSKFYQSPLTRAEKMPASFKDRHPNTAILARVLLNRGGPTPEVELLFNKWLMKISDLNHLPPKK